MKGLGMPENGELVLAVNRMKSLQKLYLFEQKGGENYLGWMMIEDWKILANLKDEKLMRVGYKYQKWIKTLVGFA